MELFLCSIRSESSNKEVASLLRGLELVDFLGELALFEGFIDVKLDSLFNLLFVHVSGGFDG